MQPFGDRPLSQYIDKRWEKINNKISGLSNEEIMANNLDILTENFYQEFFIEPLQIEEEDFSKRSIKQAQILKITDSPYYYGVSNRAVVDGIIGTFYFPFHGDSELFKYRASTFSLSGYPEITIDKGYISLKVEKSLNEMKENGAKDKLLNEISIEINNVRHGANLANDDVKKFNSSLRANLLNSLEKKREKVGTFYDIAQMFEVPIEKQEFSKSHIPFERKIQPISHKYDKSSYYCIEDKDYFDILDTIKHTASTYERTPASYRGMQEEDLRNTLLATLNATYKGNATGETFRKTGKTDICIEMENRSAFVAECKMWSGKAAVSEAIRQLDNYLTWRDCKTALIYFVRRKEFIKVLESAEESLQSFEKMRKVKSIDKNEFDCIFISESNPGQLIKLRVQLFNLYSPE